MLPPLLDQRAKQQMTEPDDTNRTFDDNNSCEPNLAGEAPGCAHALLDVLDQTVATLRWFSLFADYYGNVRLR